MWELEDTGTSEGRQSWLQIFSSVGSMYISRFYFCICVQWPQRPEWGDRSSGVTGGCEQPDLGAGNWKSSSGRAIITPLPIITNPVNTHLEKMKPGYSHGCPLHLYLIACSKGWTQRTVITVLDSLMSTWHKLKSSEEREPQLRKASVRWGYRQTCRSLS